ncbi:hypothetical protein T484DRAFT_1971901 [Baffinella frigidus]|nr:hypothetical protein T484DRAFT_1971901 [Cryptophyta sp. CCMP2293]
MGGQMGGQMGGGGGQYGAPPPIDINNPMIQMAATSGAQFFDNGAAALQSNVQQYVSMGLLRHYFSVDNSYVLGKLKVLLMPFTHKTWVRVKDVSSNGQGHAAPRNDVNAPDLYIPLMAFVTYIVVFGLHQGWTKNFKPEDLGNSASSGLAIILLEVLLLKLGFYLLDGPKVSFIDFVCYSGYKYVGIVLTSLCYVFIGRTAHYLMLALTGVAMSFFMFKTLATSLILSHRTSSSPTEGSKTQEYFVVAIAAMQLPVSWVMGI